MYNRLKAEIDMNSKTIRVDKQPIGKLYQNDGLLMLETKQQQPAIAALTKSDESLELLHRRLGHLGYRNLRILAKNSTGIEVPKGQKHTPCAICPQSKLKTKPFGTRRRATRKGEITHIDLVPSITPIGYDGSVGYVSFTDDYTAKTTIRLLRNKADAAAHIQEYWMQLKTQENVDMAIIYSDLDSVIKSGQMKQWMAEKGIKLEPTVHDTPQENGLAEVAQFHLHKTASSMLTDANLPKYLWPLALKHAAYLKERSPARRLHGKTPYEQWFGHKPDLTHLRVFGSVAYYQVKPIQSDKFAPRGIRGRFVGYDSNSTIYLIWKEGTNAIRRERNVIIHDEHQPYDGHRQSNEQDEAVPEIGAPYAKQANPNPNLESQSQSLESSREREVHMPHEHNPNSEQRNQAEPIEPDQPIETVEPIEPTNRHQRGRTQSIIHVQPPEEPPAQIIASE